MEPKTIQVTMLGVFSISYDGQELYDKNSRSHKLWSVLAYLMMNRNRSVTREELIDRFWSDERSDNPASAVKTLVFRLRAQLTDILGDIPTIVSQQGGYRWKPDVPCVFDIEQFEAACRAGNDTATAASFRMEQFSKAQALYQGDYLNDLSFDLWSLSYRMQYHTLYVDSMKQYASLLEGRKDHQKVYKVCTRATAIDQLDEEIHGYIMRALAAMGDEGGAIAHYEKVAQLLDRVMGVTPSLELQTLYAELTRGKSAPDFQPSTLLAALKEEREWGGAFLCDYHTFRHTYQLEVRRCMRSGINLFLVMIDLAPVGTKEGAFDAMERFQDCLVETLRTGDVVSKFQSSQYVVMLQSEEDNGAEAAMNRVINRFQQSDLSKRVKIYVKIEMVGII